MVIISDVSEIQNVYFPKTKEGTPTQIRFYSELTHYTKRLEVKDISDNKLYYQFSLDFSDIPMGEYEYTIYNVRNEVLEEGLIRIGDVKNGDIIYSLTETYTFYNPETGEGEIIYDNSCEEVAAQAFSDGYVSGTTDGYSSGYTSGYTDGYKEGSESGTGGYESGYTSGYTDGFNSGYTKGTTDGFNSGYTSGHTDGYQEGYTDGYNEGKHYPTGYTEGLFTIKMLEDGDISWNYLDAKYLDFYLNREKIDIEGKTLSLEEGDELSIRANKENPYSFNGKYIRGSGKHNVKGNIMSLLNPDFEDKTELTIKDVFRYLFNFDKNLISAENLILPATTLEEGCYGSMFQDCTSLTTAPALPARTLADKCYVGMFSGCLNLTTAPELPATTLAVGCYSSMFRDCTSLTTAPALPARTLANNCYDYMFYGCTSLTQAPELPATTLSEGCYTSMFFRCTSLTEAPALPSPTLANYCYRGMFYGCTSLNYIKCLATDISATYCTRDWTNGVASAGTFVKAEEMSGWTTGVNGIPVGWTVENYNPTDYSKKRFSVEMLEDGDINWEAPNLYYDIIRNGQRDEGYQLYHSIDGLLEGDVVEFYVNADNLVSFSNYTLTATGRHNVYGNIMSIVYADFEDKTELTINLEFANLFLRNTNLISAENLILPATTLANGCYYYMFLGCSSLTKAPELLATTLAEGCCINMFAYCTSLTTAPELPATTLANDCYFRMFQGCSSLTKAPELPATTLAGYCYSHMFEDCSSLTKAPELPATTLAEGCYSHMFNGCTNLNYIKCLATTTGGTTNWVLGVAKVGTFVKPFEMKDWTYGNNGIPSGWNVINN